MSTLFPHSARASWLQAKAAKPPKPEAPKRNPWPPSIAARRREARLIWHDIQEHAKSLMVCPSEHEVNRLRNLFEQLTGEPWLSPLDRLRALPDVPNDDTL